MRYVLTGYKGLIGTALKKRLDTLGWDAVQLIGREDSLENTPADILFHCAANCKINQCIENPGLAHTNALVIFEVLEYCRKNKVKKIVYFSSSRTLSEERNPYTASKVYGEELCKAYSECYGIDFLIIRPSSVYGGEDKTNRLVNIFLNKALKNEDINIFGNIYKSLDFTYIDDFLDALFLVLPEKNKEFAIGSGTSILVLNLAQEIIKQLNSQSKIYFKESELAQPQQTKIDISPLTEKGYSPKVDIKEGIKREIERLK